MARCTHPEDIGSPPPFIKIECSEQLTEIYELGQSLGKGAFGSVLLATRRSDERKFAMKKMAKTRDPRTQYGKSWENEIRVLCRYRHPNLIEVEAIYESETSCYLFMELCEDGTLADELKLRDRFAEPDARCAMRQLGSALCYLHRHLVVHRDLKLQNCLLKRTHVPFRSCQQKPAGQSAKAHPCPFTLKLTDFGLSIELRDADQTLGDNVGTPLYQAPEIVSSSSYTEKCDVWSFGIIMHILLHGCPPYTARTECTLAEEIKAFDSDRVCAGCRVCANLSSECKRALQHLLVRSPVDRWSASEFMESGWVTEQTGGSESNIFEKMRVMNRTKDK